ncbi:MAG TPA: hypothetical protein PLU67_07955 [Candidatus Kapabacteria bacterium]|nr:hypothetical protein [Candidatus Kapabacteria bacterium]HOM05410.1 hypothetical protein [Candidatus Kapabacteria bacterium]
MLLEDLGIKIKQYVNSKLQQKQDVLVSGTNIKTVNGVNLLGDGNLNLNETYYTKTEIDSMLGDIESLLSEL